MSRLQRNMNIKQYNIPGLKLLEGARYESRIYVYDNFAYNISKTRPQTLYLHCRRATCAGYAVINLLKNMKGTFDCTKPHTHVEDTEFIKNMEFRLKLKYECQRNTTNSLKEIFDSVAEKMGGIPDGISYRSIFFSMSRARRKGKQMLESGQLPMNDGDEENLDEGDHNYSCDESNREEENAEDGSVLVEMPECVVDLPMKSEQLIEEEDNTESVDIHNEYENTENNESENEYVEMVVQEVSPVKANAHQSKKFDLEDCNIIGCEVVSGLLTTGGYQVIMYDDFIYAVTKQTEDIIDLRCYKDSCSGSAVIFLNDKLEGIVKMKAAHNHRAPTEIVEGLKENKSPKRKALSEAPTSSKRTKMSHSVKVESPIVKSENNSRKNRLVGYNFPVEKENYAHDDDDDELDQNLSYSDNMDDSDYQQSANEENSSQDSDDNIADINANFLKSCRLPGMKVQMGLRTKTLVLTYKGFNYSMTRRRGNNFYFKCMLSSCGVIGTLKIDEKLGSFHLGSREHNHSEDTDFLKKTPSQVISRNKSERYVTTPRSSSKVRSQLATPKMSKGKMVKSRKLKGSLTESWDESNQEENIDEDIETIDSESVFSSKNALALRKCNLPGVTILEGLRASSFILCYENYSYRVKNRRNNSYYLECRIPKCGATAVLNVKDKEGVLRTRENHSHPEDTDYIKTIKFRAELRNECRKNPGIPARHVFEKVLARYSGEADFDISSMYRKPSLNITGDNQLNNSSDDLKDDVVGVDDISHVEEIVGGENTVEGGREEDGDDTLPSTFYSIAEFLKTCEIPGIEIIAGLRANSFMLCHGEFTYRVKNRRRNTLYLICRLDNCSSTALIQLQDKVGTFKKGPKDHNHPPDTDYINLTAFRADLRFECKKNPDTPGKQIFNSVVERHEGVNVKYREVESIIQRCKHAIRAKLSYGKIAEEALADDPELFEHKFDDADLNGELSESTLMDGDDVETSDPLKDKSRGNNSDDGDIDYDPESSLKHVDVKKLSVPGVEYLNGFRCDSQVITYNNYAYTISMQRHKCIYLRCRIKKCRGTACIARDENNEFCIKLAQDHQHGSEEHYINTLKFRQDLRKESSKHTNLSSREIFDKVSSYHKSRRGNLTYSSIETLLTRTRKRVGDQPIVRNLIDLGTALTSSEWSSAGESYHIPKAHPWFRGVFSAPDGTKIAAFLNDCICRNIQNLEPIILHLDVSYSIRPEVLKNHYVLTSHIVFYNKVFAFGFFLISRKSSIGYRKCFELIQEHSGLFKPNTVLSDYEPALHAAIRIFWPNCSIIGCYYHFVQSIVKKALVCDKLFLRDAVKRRIVKHYLSMPLIPPDYIASGHVIINKIISDENLEAEFCYLDDFFGQYWMDSIGAETFSVYGISNALNDSIEIFHHKLKHTAGARTSVWTFIDALRSLSHNEEADFLEGVESIDKVTGKMVIHKKQEKDMLKAQKELVRNLEGSSKKKFCDPDSAVDSAIASFLIKMSGILDGLLDREAQEPKQGRLIRPRRKLVSTVTNQNELMKVLNNMANHLYEVQDEDGNVISFVKPEPPCSDDEEDAALLDHDYVIEVVCEEGE